MRRILPASFLLACCLVLYFFLGPVPAGVESAAPSGGGKVHQPRDIALQPVAMPAAKAALHSPGGARQRDAFGQALPFRQSALDVALVEKLLSSKTGDLVRLPLFEDVVLQARVTGRFERPGGPAIAAVLEGLPKGDRLFLGLHEGRLDGLVEIPSRNLAYEISDREGEGLQVSEWLFSDKVCASASAPSMAGIPRPKPKARMAKASAPIQALAVPDLQSRAQAPGVIYLDFDGELVTGTAWDGGNTIDAPPARMTPDQIRETWERVVRVFEVFDVNVTTNRAVFDAAPANRKTHCVITSTDQAMPGAGGVAYLDSFTNPDPAEKICWSFLDEDPADVALIIAHEVGHTLDLNHDGRVAASPEPREEYFDGHGNGTTGWGPIMGAPYGKPVIHWSKGEYARANNPEDDLAIMTTPARIPLLADDHESVTSNATKVRSFPSGGAVSGNADPDLFKITLPAGSHTISASRPPYSILDLELRILNSTGATIATANPPNELSANVTFSIPAKGDVFIRVSGVGKEPVLGDGYSSYGSLGFYSLAGPDPEPDLDTAINEAANNAFNWSSGGNRKWLTENDAARGGEVARSGPIGHGEKSHIQTSLTGPGTLSFWWKVSSQPTYDVLRLLLNGVEQARISGNTTWARHSLVLPWGGNTVKWEYIKNGSVVAGSDAGWVDQVVFTPAGLTPPPAIAVETESGSRILSNSTAQVFQAAGLTSNATRRFVIRNTGLSNLDLGSISKTGSHAANFTVSAPSVTSIPPQGTANLDIVFAHAGTGNRTARIEIPSNDNETSPFILRLSGSATPLPIESWRISLFQNGLNSGNSSNLSDPDRDGMANLLEYGFGTNPTAADFFPPVPNDIISAGSKRHLRLYINRSRNDLDYIVEASSNLVNWSSVKTYQGIGTESPYFVDTGHDLNNPSDQRRFLRVKVQER